MAKDLMSIKDIIAIDKISNNIFDISLNGCKCLRIVIINKDSNYHLYIISVVSNSYLILLFSLCVFLSILCVETFNLCFLNTHLYTIVGIKIKLLYIMSIMSQYMPKVIPIH